MGLQDGRLPKVRKGTKRKKLQLVYCTYGSMRHKGKNQIKALPEYKEFDQKLNSMMLLKAIKKILYTSGSKNLHAKHNKAMAHISLMGL